MVPVTAITSENHSDSNAQLLVWGVNHHSAPIAIREQFALLETQISPLLQQLQKQLNQAFLQLNDSPIPVECVVVSTCNRMELYVVSPPHSQLESLIHQVLSAVLTPQQNASLSTDYLFIKKNLDAARHLFSVISGLDSMVLGETQITGQIKTAWRQAVSAQTTGPHLNHLFQTGFHVAKQVRQHTGIGQQIISFASAAVQLCCRIYGDLQNQRVLLIGAGEMIELCAAHFAAQNPAQLLITNRTRAHAEELAQKHHAQVLDFSNLDNSLTQCDIVISCTAAPSVIIERQHIAHAHKTRRNKPMVLIDLAVPRDIASDIEKLPNTYLYTVDDLGEITAQGLSARSKEALLGQKIIDRHLLDFAKWQDTRTLIPHIQALQNRVETIRKEELERAQQQLNNHENSAQVLLRFSQRLSARLSDSALAAIHHADHTDQSFLHRWLPRLFLHSRRTDQPKK